MTRIVVDDREKNESILDYFRTIPELQIECRRLSIGDYLLPNLLVERKSIIDFCESVKDARIFTQAGKLANSKIQPLIILEIYGEKKISFHLTVEAIQGAVITLSVLYSIPLIRSRSPQETARLMLKVSEQIKRFGIRSHQWRRPSPSKSVKDDKRKMQIHLLQGFQGIGPTRAIQLLDAFGGIHNIFKATQQELIQAKIPEKVVQTMLRLLD